MCGRFALVKPVQQIAEETAVEVGELPQDYLPNFNIAPTMNSLVLTASPIRQLQKMRWGLIPSWANDESIGNKMINARLETLTEKPSFRGLLKKRRCVALADGYYEWKRTEKQKIPHYIHLAAGNLLFMAALWDHWKPSPDYTIDSFTIITTTPIHSLAHIHDRMPLVLRSRAEINLWLDSSREDLTDHLQELILDSNGWVFHPVTSKVNVPSYNQPDCILPVSDPTSNTLL